MFKAYLEDFNEIKVIVKSNILFDETSVYVKNNTNIIPLIVKNKYNINDETHIHYFSNIEIVPYKDTVLWLNENLNTIVLLGKITRSSLFDKKFYFDGWLGFKYNKEKTIFRLWTPVAKEVFVIVDDIEYQMDYLDKGVWQTSVSGDLDSVRYHYKFRINEDFIETLDPYAISSLANNEEDYVIDINKTYQYKYDYYQQENFKNTDAIIYELSVRDATSIVETDHKGTFEALTKSVNEDYGLGFIKQLGITHIQLLPVFAFGGVDEKHIKNSDTKFSYNWGYNPMQYMVISGFFTDRPNNPYKRINDFKKMIDTIHSLNMGINLDVVFNHVYDNKWFPFEKLVPGYTFRTDERGYLTNASWCGNDLKTDHLMIRKLIIDTLLYFQSFYKIDGFRFDLMGLIDIETMNLASLKLRENNKYTILYGEGWNMNVALPFSQKAIMENHEKINNIGFFNDFFRNSIKNEDGILFEEKHFKEDVFKLFKGCFFYGGRFNSASQSINYVECHDNYTFNDFLRLLNNTFTDDKILDYAKLSVALVILSCGIPFIHAGQELLRTKKMIDNSYNLSDDINGINWYNKYNMIDSVKDLIKIRKEYQAFRLIDLEEIDKKIKLDTSFALPIIRVKTLNGDTLQIIVSNNYEEYTKFLVPGSTLIYDGTIAVSKNIDKLIINKPGVYIIKK